MTIHTPAVAIPSPRRGPGRRLVLGLGAVALALAVGAGLWQTGRDGGSETATPPAVTVAQPAGARPLESTPTYYLVGSQGAADQHRQAINEADAIRASMGLPALESAVIVIASAEQEAGIARMLGEADNTRNNLGLAAMRIVDLRTP